MSGHRGRKHWWHPWSLHYGPYGDQTVHWHACCAHTDQDGRDIPGCTECDVHLVGDGRECDGKKSSHRLVRLRVDA